MNMDLKRKSDYAFFYANVENRMNKSNEVNESIDINNNIKSSTMYFFSQQTF